MRRLNTPMVRYRPGGGVSPRWELPPLHTRFQLPRSSAHTLAHAGGASPIEETSPAADRGRCLRSVLSIGDGLSPGCPGGRSARSARFGVVVYPNPHPTFFVPD